MSGCKDDQPFGWALSAALWMSWPEKQTCVAAVSASDLLVDEPPRRSRAPYSTLCSRQSTRQLAASRLPASHLPSAASGSQPIQIGFSRGPSPRACFWTVPHTPSGKADLRVVLNSSSRSSVVRFYSSKLLLGSEPVARSAVARSAVASSCRDWGFFDTRKGLFREMCIPL